MIPQAHITGWRAIAPWSDDAQVEQDLVLSRAVVQLFSEPDLIGKIALRGGTSLNKLFIHPPRRYSEDIDLVQTTAGKIGPIFDAIRGQLDNWLGKPQRSRAKGGTSLTYQFESEIAPVRPLRLKIEINTREHFTLLGAHSRRLHVDSPWFKGEAQIATYELDELMGTKLRALYQRRKGRDLFDLWLCIDQGLVDANRVVECCVEYMKREGHPASRVKFEHNWYFRPDARGVVDITLGVPVSGADGPQILGYLALPRLVVRHRGIRLFGSSQTRLDMYGHTGLEFIFQLART